MVKVISFYDNKFKLSNRGNYGNKNKRPRSLDGLLDQLPDKTRLDLWAIATYLR